MTTRAEHLAWSKARAHAELKANGRGEAIASMASDLFAWSGGPMYGPDNGMVTLMVAEAMLTRHTDEAVADWIDGFN